MAAIIYAIITITGFPFDPEVTESGVVLGILEMPVVVRSIMVVHTLC